MMRPGVTIALVAIWVGCAPRVPGSGHGAHDDERHRAREAAEHAARPASAAPDRLALAQQAFADGRLPAAEGLFRQAAAASPKDPEPLLGLASTHLALRNFTAAVADVDAAIALRDGARARTLRGRALGLLRRFDAAAEDLERAVALDAKAVDAWAALVAVHVNRGDVLEARRAFAGAVAPGRAAGVDAAWTQLLAMPTDPAQPQEALDRCTRGYAALLDGEPGEAERECRSGMKSATAFPWCAAVQAEAVWWTKDLATAERMFRAAIAAFPPAQPALAADARGRLAALLLARPGAAAEAAQLAREALRVRGDRGALLDTLGRACDALKDPACAADAYGRLLRLPHLPDALRGNAEERLRALRGPQKAEARFRILQDGKWGYIDRAGKVVIPPQFDAADPFSEGLAAVRRGGRTHGYVDAGGALVLVPSFEPAGQAVHRPFVNGRAVVRVGDRFGAIDRAGKLVIPARYTELGDFSDGLALACDGEAYGWIDPSGKGVLGPAAMGGKSARGGVATGFEEMGMGRNRAFLFRAGQGRLPQEYEDTGELGDGLVPVRLEDAWGYVDANGMPVIPLRFAWAGTFSEGLAPARTDRVLCGYVDRSGAFAIPARFRECWPFAGGLARVDLARTESDRAQVAFIDRSGNPVIVGARLAPPFDGAADFVDGLAAVAQGGPPFLVSAQVPTSPLLGYVDEGGRYVWTPTR